MIRILRVTCLNIEDVKTNLVIVHSLKLLSTHTAQLLPHMNNLEITFAELFLEHMETKNKKLRKTASLGLERFCEALANHVLEGNRGEYQQSLLTYLNSKLKIRVKKSEEPLELMTCIRCMGFFSRGLKLWQGPEFLHNYFAFLIENSQSNLIDKFDKLDNFSFEHNTQNFKTVLFNQKQLNSYLKCFALISEQLEQLEKFEVKYVLRLVEMAFKYYLNYFPLYRVDLHEALVHTLSALSANISLTLEFTVQVEKIFANIFASSRDNKFHNLVFFVNLFEKVFDSPELPLSKQVFCVTLIFERVTQFLNSSDFQHPRLLCLFFQELFHQKRFLQLVPAHEQLFDSLANALEKKILKDPLQRQNLSFFSLLLKLRANYFLSKNIPFDAESLQKISAILSENLFRLSNRDRLTALECFLDMPLSFFVECPRYYCFCLELGLFLLRRPKKTLYLVQRLIKKLFEFTLHLPQRIFFPQRGLFFRVLMGCLSFQLSLSFEDRILLDAHFDSSLAKQASTRGPLLRKNPSKGSFFMKIGKIEEQEPLLAKSNLFVYNLADFRIKFEGIFHEILLIFKHFENRSVSLDSQAPVVGPLPPRASLPSSFSRFRFHFSDLKLFVSSESLFSLLLSADPSVKSSQNRPAFAQNQAFLFLSLHVLECLQKLKAKEIEEHQTGLKLLVKPILIQAFSSDKNDADSIHGESTPNRRLLGSEGPAPPLQLGARLQKGLPCAGDAVPRMPSRSLARLDQSLADPVRVPVLARVSFSFSLLLVQTQRAHF